MITFPLKSLSYLVAHDRINADGSDAGAIDEALANVRCPPRTVVMAVAKLVEETDRSVPRRLMKTAGRLGTPRHV